jgi:hypothetical protein
LVSNRADLGTLGTLVYQMNPAGTQTHVLIEYGLTGLTGSGKEDLLFFVKKSLFDGAAATDYVMFYSSMGQFSVLDAARTTGFDPTDGYEEWAILNVSYDIVPEPTAIVGLVLISGGLFWHARRRRASASRR